MLQLRPNCECCDKDLPPHATDARIRTHECTFCADCVDTILFSVCPNCGAGFSPRRIRTVTERREGLSPAKRPASTELGSPGGGQVRRGCSRHTAGAPLVKPELVQKGLPWNSS